MFIFMIKPKKEVFCNFFAVFGVDPLKIKVGKSFADSLTKGASQIYVVEYSTEVADESFDFEIDTGAVKLMVSLQNPAYTQRTDTLKVVDL